jgi:cytochrome b561
MKLKNTLSAYGLIARALHWGMAIAIIALFALGYWMRGLNYASPYYQSAPDLHQSAGMVVLALLVLRLVWRLLNPKPHVSTLTRFEHIASLALQWGFYVILFVMMVAGYFILTSDGRGFEVFGIMEIPSAYTQKGFEELAGQIHWILAYLIMAMAVLHGGAALFHHFIKKDDVLRQMIGRTSKENN